MRLKLYSLILLSVVLINFNSYAQYHIAWTRTFSEGYPSTFYPAQTKDGYLIPLIEDNTFKIAKLNSTGKLSFKNVSFLNNDTENIQYRNFFPSTKGQLFHEGYGLFNNNTRASTCLKKVDKVYNTMGFGGFVNTFKKPTFFETSAGHFEFSDSSVARIELAEIEKNEVDYPDLVYTKYDKNGNLITSYVNKNWETGYYDYITQSSILWKSFSVNDSVLMVYGGHKHKDSIIGAMGFLILDGNGKIKGVKDELDILSLPNLGIIDYSVTDVAFYKNRFYISYYITQINKTLVNIRNILVCNNNFDSITTYSLKNKYSGFFKYWPNQTILKMLAHRNDSVNNTKLWNINRELCFIDTLGMSEKCFKLKDILGNEYFRTSTSQDADYNVFSMEHHLATNDGGLLLIYRREYPFYNTDIGGYTSKTEDILVKISPGIGLDTLGHEADDTIAKLPLRANEVILYPNPSTVNILSINMDEWESITVYNSIGQIIKTYINTEKFKRTIDISVLAAGNYYFEINFPNKTVYNKFIRF